MNALRSSIIVGLFLTLLSTAQYGCAQGYGGYNNGGGDYGYGYGGGKREAKAQVEMGGWAVAYSAEMTDRDAAYGNVEPGLSIFESERSEIRDWAERTLDRSINELESRFRGDASLLRYNQDARKDARRFFVKTVSNLLRNRQAGTNTMPVGNIEVKAGVMEYISRRDNTKVVIPYLGLRMMMRY